MSSSATDDTFTGSCKTHSVKEHAGCTPKICRSNFIMDTDSEKCRAAEFLIHKCIPQDSFAAFNEVSTSADRCSERGKTVQLAQLKSDITNKRSSSRCKQLRAASVDKNGSRSDDLDKQVCQNGFDNTGRLQSFGAGGCENVSSLSWYPAWLG